MKNNANMFYMEKDQFTLFCANCNAIYCSSTNIGKSVALHAWISFSTTSLILIVSLPTNVCSPNIQSILTLLVNLHPSCMIQPKTLSND